jgi:hypothetical protein
MERCSKRFSRALSSDSAFARPASSPTVRLYSREAYAALLEHDLEARRFFGEAGSQERPCSLYPKS